MPTPETITLIVQGGAIVALVFWIWDLRAQRREERAERIQTAATMTTVAAALKELTDAVKASIEPPRRSR